MIDQKYASNHLWGWGLPGASQVTFQAGPPDQQPHLNPYEPELNVVLHKGVHAGQSTLIMDLHLTHLGGKVKGADAQKENTGLLTQVAF